MKKTILLISISIISMRCTTEVSQEQATEDVSDSSDFVHVDTFYLDENEVTSDYREYNPKTEPELIVQNPADYSAEFIAEVKQLPYAIIELKDGLLILDEKDTFPFPDVPEKDKYIALTARQDHLAIAVSLTRINYTTIDYKIEMVEFGKANHFQEGEAHIPADFFLGSEVDESDLSGLAYLSTEYIAMDSTECHTHIRLGYEESSHFLLGKLVKNCNEKIMAITLDNYPTLIEK